MKRVLINEVENYTGQKIIIQGWVHKIRKLSKILFVVIRDRSGIIQCVVEHHIDFSGVKLESVIEVEGVVKEGKNSTGNLELEVISYKILNQVYRELPIEINKKNVEANLDSMLNNRAISLKNIGINSIFKIQAALVESFGKFLNSNGFTQVFTPKIVKEGAEGGTALFQVKYFEKTAYLAQSPQFYKQMLVGAGFERVFEIGSVFRAEEHNTYRHLNEYVSLDLEMGFIKDEQDIMKLEEELLKFMFNDLKINHEKELQILNVELPEIQSSIPQMKLSEAISIIEKRYNKKMLKEDLDPEGEKLIGKYAKEELNSDFIFLTHYPAKKRPMYAMPAEGQLTHSFDLLFKGMEITTGGQRIHEYEMLKNNIIAKGLNPDNYGDYLEVFQFGMPPHGGLAIGLERLTANLVGCDNVREASLFPRDRTRVTP